MPTRSRKACTVPGCDQLADHGKCQDCQREADQRRGNFRQRGYRRKHEQRFRKGVLERDINCVICINDNRWTPATVADHWPLGRDELIEQRLDPDDPANGRGLCTSCHSRSTALNPKQAGGWNQR
jgi:5-methylcytosine-specific restriction protein A